MPGICEPVRENTSSFNYNNNVMENYTMKADDNHWHFNTHLHGGISVDAQNERYKAMVGKKILWLTCYYTVDLYDGMRSRIEGVMKTGVIVYFVIGNTEKDKLLQRKLENDGFLNKGGVIVCDMTNGETSGQNIFDAAQRLNVEFDGVFSPHEAAQTVVGYLVEKMNLPGNTEKAYCNARDKRLAREVCYEHGIPTPKFGRIDKESDVEKIVEHVGLPLVLKPSAGAASQGVYKCYTKEDVHKYYKEIKGELTSNQTFSWNPGCEVIVLVEEYIDGDEFDVDLLLWDGDLVWCNIIDNWPTMEPTFLETGSNSPSIFTLKEQIQLRNYATACVKALGFTQGAFHVECKYSRKSFRLSKDKDGEELGQPLLIEVNPRMGGGQVHMFHKEVTGVDVFDNYLMTACGIPINPPRAAKPLCAISDYEISSEVSGVMVNNKWLDHVLEHDYYYNHKYYAKVGKKIKGTDNGIPEWVGRITVKCSTPQKSINAIKTLISETVIPVVPLHQYTKKSNTIEEIRNSK